MLIGAHMSAAGGVDLAVDRGLRVGCRTMQVFAKNASQWAARPLAPEIIRRFREKLEPSGISPVVSHGSYLINLASPEDALRSKSIGALEDELIRAEMLGLLGVVLHPGAHMGQGEARGLIRAGRALAEALKSTRRLRAMILIENTAGQGTSLGFDFEHLARLIEVAGGQGRLGVCLDTCHLHAAGYDLTSPLAYARTMREFDRRVGLDRLRCIHVNDSVRPFGSRVDRHAHIARGTLGPGPFRSLMRDRRLRKVPKILETPKTGDGVRQDRMNLKRLSSLYHGVASPAPRC